MKSTTSFRFVLFELLSIFLAVFLAFGVNEWREARKHSEQAALALDAMVDEIRRNQRLVEQMLPAHENIRRITGELTTLKSVSPDSLAFLPIILRTTAWRTATETGVLNHMEYAQATALAEIYTFQEAYNQLTQDMMSSSFNIDNYQPGQEDAQLGVLRWIAYAFVENERLLLEAYEKTLAALE